MIPESEQADAIVGFLNLLLDTFGVLGSVLVVLVPLLLVMAWVAWGHHRAERQLEALKRSYEERIKELKESDDQWRRLFMIRNLGVDEAEMREILAPAPDRPPAP